MHPPDRTRVLVQEKLVLDDSSAGHLSRRVWRTNPEAIREAVTRWACRVVMLAGSPCPPWAEIATMLGDLLTALSPMRGTMRALAEVNPSGELADVVMCLSEATWHLNEGQVRATRDSLAGGGPTRWPGT